MILDRILSTRHLGLKLAAAVALDLALLTILRSARVAALCDRIDGGHR